jgi:hypothetical protein
MRRTVHAAALALAASTLFAGTAAGHIQETTGYVYQTSFDCVWGMARIADGNKGGGFARTKVRSEKNGGLGDCTARFVRPARYLATRYYYYKWDPQYQRWYVCDNVPWQYNPAETYSFTIYTEQTRPCGSGWYAVQGGSFMYNQNRWNGGWLVSPIHYF